MVIPITGFLLQRFNSRPIFMLAMSLFSAGTLIAAVAPDLWIVPSWHAVPEAAADAATVEGSDYEF